MLFLTTLGIALALQLMFFIWAAIKRTDQVTDLSYGLSFVLIALYLATQQPVQNLQALVITMVVLWGLRLATYLFIRILLIKRDLRFDGIRENFWKFAQFWFFQGLSVWVIMLPVIAGMSLDTNTIFPSATQTWETFHPAPLPWLSVLGIVVWTTGWLLETVADWQKFVFKNDPANKGKWIETGVWSWSRHPNYFGEMLCWWGVWLTLAPGWNLAHWYTLISPLYITLLLLFGTGIPTLEKKYDKQYADNTAYLSYRRRTSLLIPWPPKR